MLLFWDRCTWSCWFLLTMCAHFQDFDLFVILSIWYKQEQVYKANFNYWHFNSHNNFILYVFHLMPGKWKNEFHFIFFAVFFKIVEFEKSSFSAYFIDWVLQACIVICKSLESADHVFIIISSYYHPFTISSFQIYHELMSFVIHVYNL